MRAKSLRLVLMAVLVMIALVVAAVPSFAQSAGTGMNNWLTLQPGQSVEYRLNYLGSDSGQCYGDGWQQSKRRDEV